MEFKNDAALIVKHSGGQLKEIGIRRYLSPPKIPVSLYDLEIDVKRRDELEYKFVRVSPGHYRILAMVPITVDIRSPSAPTKQEVLKELEKAKARVEELNTLAAQMETDQ